jgi:hypothetical protein
MWKQLTLGTLAAAVFAAGALLMLGASPAGAGPTVAKPGFPAGTWIGKGVVKAPTETVADITTTFKGSVKFRLVVSKNGKVRGTGTWRNVQVGTGGGLDSKIVAVTAMKFAGTATNPTFAGTQTTTSDFWIEGKPYGHSVKTKEITGRLVIKRAGHCKVTGGHRNGDTTVAWSALLKGSGKCLT